MKKLVLLLITALTSLGLQAQYTEVGAYLGTSNYIGDLSEQQISNENYHSVLGVFYRVNATKRLSLKTSFAKGTISGSDKFARTAASRQRNLSFRSEIIELAMTGEVNLSNYNIRDNKTGVPYFFAGIALARFNPQAQMRGAWYDLQPLRTEGKKYSRNTLAVPFGLGMKFNVSYKLNVGLEFGARRTFTDFLDDVSTYYPDVEDMRSHAPLTASLSYRTPELTGEFGGNPVGTHRGDSGNNDWYLFGGVTVSVNLTDKYGLDFDKKYEVFKEHLKKPKKEKAQAQPKQPKKETASKQQKKEEKAATKQLRKWQKEQQAKPKAPQPKKENANPSKKKQERIAARKLKKEQQAKLKTRQPKKENAYPSKKKQERVAARKFRKWQKAQQAKLKAAQEPKHGKAKRLERAAARKLKQQQQASKYRQKRSLFGKKKDMEPVVKKRTDQKDKN